MSFILGVDTGGTYTDAVILEDEERVIAFSKALTTHSDLSLGIGLAIQKAIKKKNNTRLNQPLLVEKMVKQRYN